MDTLVLLSEEDDGVEAEVEAVFPIESFWALTCMAAARLEVESLRGRVVIFISSFLRLCSLAAMAAVAAAAASFLELFLPADLLGVTISDLTDAGDSAVSFLI